MRPTARARRNPLLSTAAKLCRQYLKWYGNASYKPHKNGERWLLGALGSEPMRTVLDVGANVGDWSLLAAAAFPGATIYALELVPSTAATMRERTASVTRIKPFDHGLADHTGTMTVRFNPKATAHTTFTEYPHGWDGERIEARVVRGDEFLATQGLREVDLLKVDVEGAEHLVLRGFEGALSVRRIRFIQFEYGRVNILTRFLLTDFYEVFARFGYVVGKIYPDHVEFRDYQLGDEDFLGPNYLACRADEPFIPRLLGTRPAV